MKTLLTICLSFGILSGALHSHAQDESLLYQNLMEQVEAFKKGDIEQMTTNVHEDFKWYYIAADSLMLEVSGKEAFREAMKGYFSSIDLVDSEIVEWVIDGNRISFQEKVSWRTPKGVRSQTSMGIYEYRDNKIYRVWYFL